MIEKDGPAKSHDRGTKLQQQGQKSLLASPGCQDTLSLDGPQREFHHRQNSELFVAMGTGQRSN
jgi:hypothetical protein